MLDEGKFAGDDQKATRRPLNTGAGFGVGAVPIPKSSSAARIAENFRIFDFSLSDADMTALATLDRGNRLGGDPDQHVEL